MPSELKELMAKELGQAYSEGTDYVVVGFDGLAGNDTMLLRRKMRESSARMRVVKNSIVRRVLEGANLGAGVEYVDGPSALVTGEAEMPALCKLVADLAKKHKEQFFVRGGLFEGAALDAAGVGRLALIPPMPVLQSQIVGSVYGQLAGVASAFQCIARSLACALEGIREKKAEAEG